MGANIPVNNDEFEQLLKRIESIRKKMVQSKDGLSNDILSLNPNNIQALVRSSRKAMGSTQENVSDVSGVALKTVQKIEHGEMNINLQNFKRVLDVLGIEICLRRK